MADAPFKALVVRQPTGVNEAAVEDLRLEDLPPGDTVIRVHYSDIGYKDGLAITGAGHRQLLKSFPFVPGVDLSGVVEQSASARLSPGDPVIVTGWGLGEHHWGGFAQRARVRSEWVTKLPAGMTLRQAMAYGSAGLSAMLCIDALERYGVDRQREVLVTGAAGGVGSVALMLLHKLGYRAVASTRRPDEAGYLTSLGAARVVDAREFNDPPAHLLLAERWGGAIDNVGGTTLANVLASLAYGGAVASLGLVGGRDLVTTVMPFITRNVALLGVDSTNCPAERRDAAWRRLVEVMPEGLPEAVIDEIPLEAVAARAAAVLRGEQRGRTVVAL